jgi:hypothetical protein
MSATGQDGEGQQIQGTCKGSGEVHDGDGSLARRLPAPPPRQEATLRARVHFNRLALASVLMLLSPRALPLVHAEPRLAGPSLTVRLRIRVAECTDPGTGARAATRSPSWVDDHVKAVQTLLAPHGITVTAARETFAPAICEVLTRADRDTFAQHVASHREGQEGQDGQDGQDGQALAAKDDRSVTVLVLPRVRDLDVLTYDLMGVHWRAHGQHWIFLTARAQPPVLAHELCHYFGLPHDPAGGNLMTPGPSSPLWNSSRPPRPFAPVLTPGQVERLRAGIAVTRAGNQ